MQGTAAEQVRGVGLLYLEQLLLFKKLAPRPEDSETVTVVERPFATASATNSNRAVRTAKSLRRVSTRLRLSFPAISISHFPFPISPFPVPGFTSTQGPGNRLLRIPRIPGNEERQPVVGTVSIYQAGLGLGLGLGSGYLYYFLISGYAFPEMRNCLSISWVSVICHLPNRRSIAGRAGLI